MKKRKNLAQIVIQHYPIDIFIEDPDKIKTMKQLGQVLEETDCGDGLFDFIVQEIGKERNKNEILILLNKAIGDIQSVVNGILHEY